jgi:hypothetical protein
MPRKKRARISWGLEGEALACGLGAERSETQESEPSERGRPGRR